MINKKVHYNALVHSKGCSICVVGFATKYYQVVLGKTYQTDLKIHVCLFILRGVVHCCTVHTAERSR